MKPLLNGGFGEGDVQGHFVPFFEQVKVGVLCFDRGSEPFIGCLFEFFGRLRLRVFTLGVSDGQPVHGLLVAEGCSLFFELRHFFGEFLQLSFYRSCVRQEERPPSVALVANMGGWPSATRCAASKRDIHGRCSFDQ